MTDKLTKGGNPLATTADDDETVGKREDDSLIYESIMRGGGVPFGRPFEVGVNSLTEKLVKLFGQKSFFGFESLERPSRRRNKFTLYGAARNFSPLKRKRAAPMKPTQPKRKK